MLLKYSLLLLGLIDGFQGHQICNFEKHLCDWKNLYSCHFTHETSKPLEGESGYLFLSKNTCEKAGITFPVVGTARKFQLHYFINGTGSGTLAVSAVYFYTGSYYVWSCNMNQGPRWNKADIFVKSAGLIDSLSYINIEATVTGDMTVAIGNISSAYTGRATSGCSRPQVTIKPKTRKATTIKQTTNAPRTTTTNPTTNAPTTSTMNPTGDAPKTSTIQPITNSPKTPIPQTTSSFITSSTNPKTHRSTEKAAVTSQDIKETTERRSSPSYTSMADQSGQKDTTEIPAVTVTGRNNPKPTTTTGPQQSTLLQDVTTSESVSEGITEARSSKSKQGAIIGGSVFAAVFVIVIVAVIAVLMYKRRVEKWDVLKSTTNSIENPVYQ